MNGADPTMTTTLPETSAPAIHESDLEAVRELHRRDGSCSARSRSASSGRRRSSTRCSSRCSRAVTACSSASPASRRRSSSPPSRTSSTCPSTASVHAGPHALRHHGHRRARGGPHHRPPRASASCARPIFANLLLADEINRTPPKTQAALLQAMQEYRVTAGGETYPLDLPFLVFATQNPIEQEAPIRCPRRSSTGSCST